MTDFRPTGYNLYLIQEGKWQLEVFLCNVAIHDKEYNWHKSIKREKHIFKSFDEAVDFMNRKYHG